LNAENARWLRDLRSLYDVAWESACPQDLNRYCGDFIEVDASVGLTAGVVSRLRTWPG